MYDVLYLPEELVLLDPGEAFGETARLYTYGPQSDESVYTRMDIRDVPCLPYRPRITNKATCGDLGTLIEKSINLQSGDLYHPVILNRGHHG